SYHFHRLTARLRPIARSCRHIRKPHDASRIIPCGGKMVGKAVAYVSAFRPFFSGVFGQGLTLLRRLSVGKPAVGSGRGQILGFLGSMEKIGRASTALVVSNKLTRVYTPIVSRGSACRAKVWTVLIGVPACASAVM